MWHYTNRIMIFPKDTFLYTNRKFRTGDVIMRLGNAPCPSSDSSRIQVDDHTFILPPKLLAHSCQPNAYIDWISMELRALYSLDKGTLVTYHYGTSEDDYRVGKFTCECGSPLCVGMFPGFMYLSDKEKKQIKELVSQHIRKKYFREG